MSDYRDCNARQPLLGGPVRVKSNQHEWREGYLQAFSGISENEPAKLKLYHDLISIPNEKFAIQEILFTDVRRVNYMKGIGRDGVITIEMVGQDVTFYADSSDSTVWFNYCDFLHTIPCYAIPEAPQENIFLQKSIEQYIDLRMFDAASMWVVQILMEGIAKSNIALSGLHIITIRSSDATFNVHDSTGKQLLSWYREAIKRSGCIESLVYLETGKCREGPGLLWMQHSKSQAIEMHRSLQEFLYFGAKNINQLRATTQNKTTVSFPPPHADHHIDLPAVQPPPYNDPDYQHDKCRLLMSSQVSLNSQCSSGYYSESSSLSNSCHDDSEAPLYPKGTFKSLKKKEKKGSAKSSRDVDRFTSNGEIKHPNSSYYATYASSQDASSFSSKPLSPSIKAQRRQYGGSVQQSLTVKSPPIQNRSYSDLKASGRLSPTPSIKAIAFRKCTPIIVQNLNIQAVPPHLMENGMLTLRDTQVMRIQTTPDVDKVMHLIEALPKQGDRFFEKFLLCLRESEPGTGHADIAKSLTAALKEVKETTSS